MHLCHSNDSSGVLENHFNIPNNCSFVPFSFFKKNWTIAFFIPSNSNMITCLIGIGYMMMSSRAKKNLVWSNCNVCSGPSSHSELASFPLTVVIKSNWLYVTILRKKGYFSNEKMVVTVCWQLRLWTAETWCTEDQLFKTIFFYSDCLIFMIQKMFHPPPTHFLSWKCDHTTFKGVASFV